jgi:pilus assembly protein CpaB
MPTLRPPYLLGFAVLLGSLAVYLVQDLLRQVPAAPLAEVSAVELRPVVVAARDLAVGTRLAAEHLQVQSVLPEMIPEGAFTRLGEVLGDLPQPEWAPVVMRDFKRGEIILASRLSDPGARSGLAARIPENLRAVTISTDEIHGVAGFVLPGDHVDILLTSTPGDNPRDLATQALLQNVPVLAVDQILSQDADDPRISRAVTLLLPVEDAQKITLAQRVGQVKLLLRNAPNLEEPQPRTVHTRDLHAPVTPPRTTAATTPGPTRAAPGVRVEVIRGLHVGTVAVPAERAPAGWP